jgi:hypothetical protein
MQEPRRDYDKPWQEGISMNFSNVSTSTMQLVKRYIFKVANSSGRNDATERGRLENLRTQWSPTFTSACLLAT